MIPLLREVPRTPQISKLDPPPPPLTVSIRCIQVTT